MNPKLNDELNSTSRFIPDDDEEPFNDIPEDDNADVPIDVVVSVVLAEGAAAPAGYAMGDEEVGLVRTGAAEDIDLDAADVEHETHVAASTPQPLGRGKRLKIPSSRYKSAEWDN
ncbi:hypothetical protein HGRIS_001174 [Hohenbuehelia grisea]